MNHRRSLTESAQIAVRGLAQWIQHEPHARTWLVGLIALVLLAAYIRATPTQWAALFLGATSIASAELLNTAVERLADFIRPQPDARIGLIKDLAAAAVLLAILSTTAAAGLVVWDRWGTSTPGERKRRTPVDSGGSAVVIEPTAAGVLPRQSRRSPYCFLPPPRHAVLERAVLRTGAPQIPAGYLAARAGRG